eukprot:10918404-Alexandrium_andersonii.AAC.1
MCCTRGGAVTSRHLRSLRTIARWARQAAKVGRAGKSPDRGARKPHMDRPLWRAVLFPRLGLPTARA